MKIQIKSDTHNELYFHKTRIIDPQIRNMDWISTDADVIVLAGDIATPETAISIVQQYGDIGKKVLYVAGNHDYWGRTIEEAKENRNKIFEGTNIIELDRGTHIIDDVVFIGATLWTNLSHPTYAYIASTTRDFERIKDLTPNSWNNRHLEDYKYIHDNCLFPEYRNKKKVVITHYLPSPKSIGRLFEGNVMNCIFMSNCEEIMALDEGEAPNVWIHGHTHDSFDYQCHNTRVICNPYGYHGYEINPKFNPDLVIEV